MRQKFFGRTMFGAGRTGTGGISFLPAPGPSRFQKRWIDDESAKRGFDVVGATLILVFFLPVIALIWVALSVGGKGGIFYGHRRLGRGGKPFPCLKFRTMCVDGDRVLGEYLRADPVKQLEWTQTRKLRCDPRVTRIGRLLRTSSLDELPQLFNVLRGDMSLVGPRPIVEGEEAANYGSDLDHCLGLRPGITGLWQVSGRNNTTYAERVAFDARYCRERTMKGDLGILLRTVSVVLTGDGAY